MEKEMLYSSPQRDAVLLYLTSFQVGTEQVHHICTVQCSLYVLLIELGFTGQGGSTDFLTKGENAGMFVWN